MIRVLLPFIVTDVPEGNHKYVTEEWGVKKNVSNPKPDKVVIGY